MAFSQGHERANVLCQSNIFFFVQEETLHEKALDNNVAVLKDIAVNCETANTTLMLL